MKYLYHLGRNIRFRRPDQCLRADIILQKGHYHLVMINQYNHPVYSDKLASPDMHGLIRAISRHFMFIQDPSVIQIDKGPCFNLKLDNISSELGQILRIGITKHITLQNSLEKAATTCKYLLEQLYFNICKSEYRERGLRNIPVAYTYNTTYRQPNRRRSL